MKPQRIQLSRKKGFDLQAASMVLNGLPAVNVARPGRWGNPWRVDDYRDCGNGCLQHVTRQIAVMMFRKMLREGKIPPFALANIREELRGKNLACWCALNQPCHADVLLQIANA